MKSNWLAFSAILIALSAPTEGWAWTQAAAKVGFSRCPRGSHTEAYPKAIHLRHAFGCKSDEAGYLEGRLQGDERGN